MTRYLTEEVFSDVVASFEWPAEYSIEDDLPDGMILQFPKCSLYFAEGIDANMELKFLPEDTGVDIPLDLVNAMMVVKPLSERDGSPLTEGLFKDKSPWGSEAKVRHGIHDLCLTMLTHLQPVILGDFSWVAKYRAMTGR